MTIVENMLDVGKETLKVLRCCFKKIVVLHIVYIVLGFIIFGPLTGVIINLFFKIYGNNVIADMDILYFVLSPFGIVSLVIYGAILVTIFSFELASIITVCAGILRGYKIAPTQILIATIRHGKTLFVFALHLIGRIILITAPFFTIAGTIGWFILKDYDINYYLTVKPPAFIFTAVLVGCVFLVMSIILVYKLIGWTFSLPLVLFNNIVISKSFNQSRLLVSGYRTHVLLSVIIWTIISFMLSSLLFGVIHIVGTYLIGFFHESLGFMVILLGILATILTLANLLIVSISIGGFSCLLVVLHKRLTIKTPTIPFESLQAKYKLGLKTPSLTLALVCSFLISIGTGWWLVQGIQTNDNVEIIAHRGAAGKAPENTMAAIRQAIVDDADWVEIDVQETKDGEVIVTHDSDFMKLAGESAKVWDLSLEGVKKIDVGSWYSAEFSKERVPTLQEVLEEVRGKAGVFIELKYYGHDEQLEKKVVDIVEAADMVENVTIMSLKYDGIVKVRSLRPTWNVGLLSATAIGNLTTLDVDFLAVNSGMATSSFIESAHSANKQVMVWTINDRISMSRMMSLGVDGIITDEPELARAVLDERSEMSSVERLLLHSTIVLGQPLPKKNYRDNSP